MTAAGSSLSTANGSDFMRARLTSALSTYRIWPVLILLLAGAALASGGIFLRPSNLVAILFVAAPTTIAALGQTLVIMTAGIDLSVAAIWVLSAVIAAQLANEGWSLAVSVLSALCVGLAGGLANGCLVAVLRVPPLITTLGTLSICEGVARVLYRQFADSSVPPDYKALGGSYFGPVPLPTLILFAVVLLLVFIMHRMAIGKQVYAVGGNPVAPLRGLASYGGLDFRLRGQRHARRPRWPYPKRLRARGPDQCRLRHPVRDDRRGCRWRHGADWGERPGNNTVGGVLVIVVVQNTMNVLGVSPLLSEGVLGTIVLVAVYLNVGLNPQLLLAWVRAAAQPFHHGPEL